MSTEPILQFFRFEHLPPTLQTVSAAFSLLAHDLVRNLPDNIERSEALRKLLEAKDCAVRARLFKPEPPQPSFGPQGVTYAGDPPGLGGGGAAFAVFERHGYRLGVAGPALGGGSAGTGARSDCPAHDSRCRPGACYFDTAESARTLARSGWGGGGA
jgi:hypothetical protein